MRKACVIGYPVSHSLSPRLHGYWLKQYGIDGSYVAQAAAPEALEKTVKSLAEQGFSGCNITVPHKESVMAFLDGIDDAARAIGAVNTVVIKDKKLFGSNTDAYGFMQNVKNHAGFVRKEKAVILGAGGAAKAVIKALLDEGFSEIVLCNRTEEKAKATAAHFVSSTIKIAPWDERSTIVSEADMLVNTTSLGLKNNEALAIDLSRLPQTAIVTDLVYNPLITPLLQAAQARGNVIVDGLGMLIHQAVPGFEAWFGVRPEPDARLRNHLLEAL